MNALSSSSLMLTLAVLGSPAGAQVEPPSQTDVELVTSTGTLRGSLLLPPGQATVPAVLILPGSGPTDRNGNGPGLSTDAYLLLARGLAAEGIASLRIDKRGIAASAAAGPKEDDLRFSTYVEDAAAWAAYLGRQPRVSRVIVLGHSEGALVGSIVAQRPGIAGFVSLAGVGAPAADILRRQLVTALPPSLLSEARNVLSQLEKGQRVANTSPDLAPLFRPSVQGYLISWFRIDPRAELAKVKVPVLIVQGSTDLQVSVADAQALKAALPSASLRLVGGMNHILRAAPATPTENVATYSRPDLPLAPSLVPSLMAFIQGGR